MPTDSTLSPPRRRRHAEPLRLLRAAAYAVAGLCLLPILAVTLAGVTGGVETLTHLAQTVLPRYAGNTLVLVACVALGTLSIGITMSEDYEALDMAQLQEDADIALYASKNRGRACHTFYDPELRTGAFAISPEAPSGNVTLG